jgi:signal transduction histidine kinase
VTEETQENFRILVVDDEEAILEQFERILVQPVAGSQNQAEFSELQDRLFGSQTCRSWPVRFELTLCRQGGEAVEEVRESIKQDAPFAVVFIDMRMPPGHDGLWTARHIREIDKDIQIVIVTAFSDTDSQELLDYVGPLDKLLYIQKPFYPQEIRQFATALSARWLAEQRAILEIRNEVLKESDRFKMEFIMTISHELRTPLAIFKNIVSNAIAGVMGPINQKLRDNLQIADNHLHRLSLLIADFLDIADIDAGQLHLNLRPIPMQQMVSDAVERVRPEAKAKQIRLNVFMPEQNLLVNADKRRLTQVLLNLLSNAVRYMQKEGNVDIRLSELDNELQVVVEDNGPGIEKNDIARVFNRFIQIRRQVGPGQHGIGLGLTIAKAIVELHGGRIWIESIPGDGSCVCFAVPKYQSTPENENNAVSVACEEPGKSGQLFDTTIKK